MTKITTDQTAADAHTTAVQHNRAMTEKVASAQADLDSAIAARDALLARASEGENIVTSDLRDAETTIRDREVLMSLARAVASGAERKMHQAEIAALRARADELMREWQAAVVHRIETGRAVDDAIELAQRLLADHRAAHDRLVAAHLGASRHDISIKQITNPELSRLSSPEEPRVRHGVLFTDDVVGVHYVVDGFGGLHPRTDLLLEERARAEYGSQAPQQSMADGA